jgi:GT2 family glycosyltransferase
VPALCIVPTYLREPIDAELLVRCLVSMHYTAPDAQVLVVDDHSPARHLAQELQAVCAELGQEVVLREENGGFSSTVNIGLRHALERGLDAVLVNQDIQFVDAGWLELMLGRTDTEDRPAAVVGARLLYPDGLIQHGGIFFSRLHQWFDHSYRFAPGDLPEANLPRVCPVTGALQLIRHATLETIGIYDERFKMGWEDMDYCLRVFDAGLECVYEPQAWAMHHESAIRGRLDQKIAAWTHHSRAVLDEKHDVDSFARFLAPLS